ncbi:MAG: 2OG-Fe(II) oxygenase family protein [bacterium]
MSAGHSFRELAPGSFIYAIDDALDNETCHKMIERFESSPDQQNQGKIGQNAATEQSIKRSTDLRISGRKDWLDIDQCLQQSLSHGLSLLAGLHPFFKTNRLNDTGYNMQKTVTSEYYHWHIDGGPGEFSKRQLVAIWYLNAAPEDGGETEFFFQKLSVRPERGMLLLFPPFWTHLHRGNIVGAGTKYIATTWVCVS